METDPGRRMVDYLPAVYRRSRELEKFLVPFEEIFFRTAGQQGTGNEGKEPKSLEQRADEIHNLFDPDPKKAPSAFLQWLAQWAALSLSEGTPEERLRRLIKEMIPLYRKRGTRKYVEKVLQLYTGAESVVEEEDLPGMQIGVRSTIGRDTRLGEDPFRFHVQVKFSAIPASREERLQLVALVHTVVGLAKPAHTHYQLSHNLAEERLGLVISFRSTVGIDTLLWGNASTTSDELDQPDSRERQAQGVAAHFTLASGMGKTQHAKTT